MPTPELDSDLVTAWAEWAADKGTPFYIPGHKGRVGELWPELGAINATDAPMYGAMAPIKAAEGALARAEAHAATLWGADWCRYSTGGSTHANQTVALAVGQPGDEVLVARNAHRSVLSGLILAGLTPRWLVPDVVDEMPRGISTTTLAAAIESHPGAKAVFLVEPSYVGTLSDRRTLIEMAHAAGMAVIIDQAWGAHFGFHAAYPEHAIALGADALVTSAHKTLPAHSQGSLLLALTTRLDPGRLDRAFDLTHTTSPAGNILASIDGSVVLLGSEIGTERLGALAEAVAAARARLESAGLPVLDTDDPAKLVISLPYGGGLALEQHLIAAGLGPEQADETTLIPMPTLVDDPADVMRFVDAVLAHLPTVAEAPPAIVSIQHTLPPAVLTPREAFFAATETVSAADAIGRVSAEVIAPYPPGVPVLVPGEAITAGTVALLQRAAASGVRIAYAADPSLSTFVVTQV
jgi:lysine decarboxylase